MSSNDDIPAITYGKARKEHYLEYFLLCSLSSFWNFFPEKLSLKLASMLSIAVKPLLKRRNSSTLVRIENNLEINTAEANRILSSAYMSFATNWVAMVRSQKLTREIVKKQMNLIGFDQFETLKKEGRGAVIASMHMGWWEISPRIFCLLEIPLAVMVGVQHNPLSDKFINGYREQKGYHKILHNRLSVRHTIKFLKNGGFLVVVADVDAGRSGLNIPFLKEDSSTSRWPAELSLRTDSPIIVGLNYENDSGKRTFEMHEKIDPRDYSDCEDATYSMTQKMNSKMSKMVVKYPEQWFWLQRRWKTVLEK